MEGVIIKDYCARIRYSETDVSIDRQGYQMHQTKVIAASVLALAAAVACADTEEEKTFCKAGTTECRLNTLLRCVADGSGHAVETDCVDKGKVCVTGVGCLNCVPDATKCVGQDVLKCKKDGSGFDTKVLHSCDASKGMICDNATCINACKLARQNRSYVGCEYWAVDLDNAVVKSGSAASQQFAVALSNPSTLAAKITVSINEAAYGKAVKVKTVATRTVKPQGLEVLLLPAREVDGSPAGKFDTGGGTAVTPNAYKIESSVPIIAYQFNPLSNVGVFSNDASLLVPTPALTTDTTNESGASYLVLSWPQTIATSKDSKTNFGTDLRAFLTIVGTRKGTEIKVKLNPDTIADKEGLVPAKKSAETLTFKLEPYDVLNLETGYFAADFTGTRISTNYPVAVFTGSEASDVPDFLTLQTRKCCADHLEQQLFPSTTFGRVFIALKTPSRTEALSKAGATITINQKEKEYFRVLSAGEFVKVTTNLAADPSFSVANGKYKQVEVDQDFTIVATGPVAVGQYVAGQEQAGIPSSLPGGDPSFILLPAVEQFRKDYLFLTPDKYAFDYIMVAAPRGAKVTLDGRPLASGCDSTSGKKICCSISSVGSVTRPGDKTKTLYDAIKCQLSFPKIIPGKVPPDNLEKGLQDDGVHRLKSNMPVGLVVYGFDAYVSYGYPGGTELKLINLK